MNMFDPEGYGHYIFGSIPFKLEKDCCSFRYKVSREYISEDEIEKVKGRFTSWTERYKDVVFRLSFKDIYNEDITGVDNDI